MGREPFLRRVVTKEFRARTGIKGSTRKAWVAGGFLAGLVFLTLGLVIQDLFLVPAAPSTASLGLRQLHGSPEQSDWPLQFAVWWEEVRRLLREGEPPWISPRIGGGAPLFANGQTGLPWPLQAPVWLWGPERGTTIMALFKVLAAFWGMRLWLSALGCPPAAVSLGALAWAFSLDLWSWLPVPLSWVMALAPAAFWLLALALRGKRAASGALALLLGGLLGWSTHPESAAFLLLGLALGGLVLSWGRSRRLGRWLVPVLLALLIGAGFGAPVILTIADSAKWAAGRPPGEELSLATQAQVASLLLVPFRLGHPADGTFALPFPHAPVALACGSVIWLVLLAGRTRRRHRRWVWALAILLLVALGLFLQAPGFRQLVGALPMLQSITWPRVGFLIPLALVALAALRFPLEGPSFLRLLGAWGLVQGAVLVLSATSLAGAGSRVWPTAFVPTLAAVALGLPRRKLLVPLLAALEVGFWSASVLPISRPQELDPFLARLPQLVGPGERILALAEVVPANSLARIGLADLRSHDPVRPRALARVHQALGAQGQDLPGPLSRPWAGLAGAWGVRWLLSGPEGLPPAFGRGWQEVSHNESLRLFRNLRFQPPLRLAEEALLSPGDPGLGGWENLDFSRQAVVEQSLSLGGKGELLSSEVRPWRVRVRVRAQGRVLALWHSPKAPGWQAFLDGQPVDLVVANGGAMGVVVPSGEHWVEWRYWPPGFGWGWGVGCLGLLLALAYARKGGQHAFS